MNIDGAGNPRRRCLLYGISCINLMKILNIAPRLFSRLFVILFLFQTRTATAQNLAQNPGFESGTTGWSAFGDGNATLTASTVQKHSGSFSGLVQNRTATWNGAAQSFLGVIQPGIRYNISAWVELASGPNQTVMLTMKKTDGTSTTFQNVANVTASSSGWAQLSGTYTLSVTGVLSDVTLYMEGPAAGTNYYCDDFDVEAPPTVTSTGLCNVDWNVVYQRIDGFGASSAWRSSWTTAQANMLFSTNTGTTTSKNGTNFNYTGIALSLLRTRIAPGGTTIENSIMQLAQARGAKVWATPWTPVGQFKDSGVIDGGNYLGGAATNQTYAAQLGSYVFSMKNTFGVNIYAISVQNEPDSNHPDPGGYESCIWTAQKIHDFIPYLYAALSNNAASATKIIAAESENWKFDLATTAMNDTVTSNMVGILAAHSYGSLPSAVTTFGTPVPRALWETEHANLSGDDGSINDGVAWGGEIHNYLTVAQANAWHFWWLITGGNDSNEGLMGTNEVPTKRMYTVGNFSRFVRPGYYRIGATNSGSAQITAFKYPGSGNFAIVAINSSSGSVTQQFNLFNFSASNSVTPWITSSNLSLGVQAPVIASNSFTYVLPAVSVTTFVWQTNLPPDDITLLNASVMENKAVNTTVGTLLADDPDPNNTFTYALASGAGSADNASFNISGTSLRTSAMFDYETKNSYSIRVRATDQGGLFNEKIFNIVVTDTNEPPVASTIPDQAVNAGITVVVTNILADPEAQPMTFALLGGPPTNAVLNTASGIFSWRPVLSQADTTNVITVKATDSGVPALSGTNSFKIKVNPLTRASIGPIATSAGQIGLELDGPIGPDYTVWASSNLTDWQTLLVTNSPAVPIIFVDTNLNAPARFYRLQIGP